MYRTLRKILFLLNPETAHRVTFTLIKFLFFIPGIKPLVRWIYEVPDPRLERELFGIKFSNPVGLAAGLDKDARLFRELGCFGFSHVEIGTVTPLPQEGNPRPRLFRLPADEALINRMGFNNSGMRAIAGRLRKRKKDSPVIGGNIGKNKSTSNEDALTDYLKCLEQLFDHVDYFVVNVSSPNTPGLRTLQEKEPLKKILGGLMALNRKLAAKQKMTPRPVLLKIAPDLSDGQLDDIVSIVSETGISGIIATNTTISREGVTTEATDLQKIGAGGLSGKPLRSRSTEVIRYLHQKSGGTFPIVGVGGIHSAEDALEKLEAGASLVQLYTGFIYNGPSLVNEINMALVKKSR